MENIKISDILLALLIIWQLALTFFFLKTKSSWGKVTKEAGSLNLVQTLENILGKQNKHEATIARIAQDISKLGEEKKLYLQKSAFVRYNPFEETGGDQSFIVAILDGNNSGFVISSLHSRNGTRIYAKQILMGKESHQLSKEEKEVVDKAARQKA